MSTAEPFAARLDGAPLRFRIALDRLARTWETGSLSVTLPNGTRFRLGDPGAEPQASLIVRDYRFLGRCMLRGDVGFADGYMAGEWDSPDLAALLHLMALNFDRMKAVSEGGRLMRKLGMIAHRLRGNTLRGARRNIEAHYDLGNDFYAAWLDPGMAYSAALYDTPGLDLEAAQTAKFRALAQAIGLAPGQTVLEIGCGWGGFAEMAARDFGARVVGLTLSPAQQAFAQRRLFEAGLADRVEVRLMDYRQVEGRFDRIVSIEMFEAVGERYWDAYFGKIAQVLAPGGRAGLQVITIQERLFERYRTRMDFIQAHIFPGGMLPSETVFDARARAAGLTPGARRRFGPDYARTLADWAARFEAAWPQIRAQGFDERFHRLWRFYLAYCEAGFRTGRTDVMQVVLET